MSRSIFRLFLIITMLLSGTPTPPAAAQAEAPELVTFNALSLAGFDGYARVSHSSELNNLSAMTIEAWVWRNETLRGETIVGNGWTESYWLGFAPEGKLRFITHGGGDLVDSNVTVYAGEWTHVAVTYNGLTRNFYINGALDKTTNESPGAIAPNPSDPLGIGYDADPFTGNYFDGVLDEVRIWKTVRSQAEIQAGMFQAFSAPLPANLIGYWRLNGDASDETGDHDGIMQGGLGAYSWINGGALPHDIRIPQTSAAHTLNGRCDPSEYTSATVVSVEGAEIYLDHTATDLWVCYHFYTDSSYTRASVLLDLNHGRLDPAQPDDLRLDVHDDDTLGTYVGDDAGHWVITDTYDTLWDGEYTQYGPPEFPYYNIEFRLDQSLVGGWSHVIGLALDPYIPGLYGFDMAGIWPALAANTLPSTWSSATLGGISPPRTFSGKVEYQPKNLGYDPTSVAGAHIELIGYDVGGSEALVATDTTGPSGSFSLTTDDDYTQHRLEILGIPQGYNYTEADAPSPGTVLDERTIDYGEAGPGTYPDNTFTLGDVIPSNSSAPYGPVFLIIAPDEVIDSGALDEFRTFKIQQGYAVSIRSVEETNSYPGPTRLERIRALEQEYLQTYGARFQFLMLIGTHEVIPFAKITPYATGEGAVCPTEEPKNYKFSDWLYVDLTSNFDGNGNGCYADGALTNPDKLVSGYTPDSGIAFDPTVALGRLPFTDPNTIRNVLRNSVGFEKQSESYKLDALNGMSLVALKGYFDGEICSDNWGDHCVPPSSNSQYSYDTAVLSEEMKNDFLNVNGFDTTELYENEAAIAGGIGVSSPDLTLANVRQALDDGRFGLAVMSGHGNSTGVYRNFWASDKNGNGVVDVSDSSSSNELSETQFFDINGVLNQVGAEGSRGSVFVLLACSNASPTNSSNLAATILADGHGPASVAALSVVTVGSWLNENHGNVESIGYYVNKRLVSNSYRLGEAVWWTMADLVHKKISGSGGVAYDLYGDPTLSFYGNPGGQTTLAAWPMSRRDPAGASYLSLPGPTVPKKLWDYTTGPHGSDLPGQTPLVSANGEVIVAGGSYVDVLRQGVLHQRLSLDASIFGNPALSADGTIYAMDLDGNLYAFPYKRLTLNGHTIITSERYRRWTVDLGEYPQTAITIGSDGYILAGMGGSDPVLWMVRPDGVKFSSWALDHSPASYITTDASRAVYVATDVVPEGHLYRFNLFCDTFVYPDVCPHNSWVETTIPYAFNTPPILLYGSLYIGDVNNTLYKFNKDTLATEATFTADSAIMHGPMATPSGDVLIISSQGVMYSLTKNLATVRWQKNLGHTATFGIPAASSNAIYLAFDGYLRAYSPSGGGQLWKRSLGSEFAYAGVSVGYGREVYVQGVLGQVQAFGEGWALSLAKIVAIPGINLTRPYFRVEMLQNLPPISGTLQTTPLNPPILAPSEDAPAEGEAGREWGDEKGATADIVGILLQRSADGGPWEDLTILPPGAEVFTDTNIDANTRYAYRAQNLMSDGQNSDFATIPEIVQSYPNLPGAPTLEPVQPESADALQLTWASNPGDVVSAFRLERAENAGGPFTTVITLTSETTAFVDSGLAPATTYYYRVIALNDTGSSAPSNVEGGATRSQSLDSPQNFQAALANPGQISLTWDAGPTGATAVIEIEAFGMSSYEFLATAPADGSFTYHTGEPNAYDFRIKFVQGDDESTYAYSESVVIADPQVVYLPIVRK